MRCRGLVGAGSIAALMLLAGACARDGVDRLALVPGGDPARGRAAIREYGCGTCHVVPGVNGARGRVGPSLAQIGEQRIVAGRLPNTPENLINWIVAPLGIDPNTAMPLTGIDRREARDVVAYLYSLDP